MPGESTDAGVYAMTFGKYIGKTLDEVPRQYLQRIVDNDVHKGHADLVKALRPRGNLNSKPSLVPVFKVPEEPDDIVFYDPWTDMKI